MSSYSLLCFFFNDTPTTEIYTLSLHDALPISPIHWNPASPLVAEAMPIGRLSRQLTRTRRTCRSARSEEHTSELQSPDHLVCRLLLEKKKKKKKYKNIKYRRIEEHSRSR